MKSRQHRRAIGTDGFNALEGLARVFQSLHKVADYCADWLHRSSQTRFVLCRVQLAAWLVMPSAQPFFFQVIQSAFHLIASVFVISRKETNTGGSFHNDGKVFHDRHR